MLFNTLSQQNQLKHEKYINDYINEIPVLSIQNAIRDSESVIEIILTLRGPNRKRKEHMKRKGFLSSRRDIF